MDWSKVKKAVGAFAPWIAGTLGTPVAGAAVQALCNVFGLSGDQQTPANALQAVGSATPEQLLALKEADTKHREFMAQLGFKEVIDLEQIAETDRDSARKREEEVKDKTPRNLAYLLTLGFFGLLAALFVGTPPPGALSTLQIMTGSLGTAWVTMIAYYYGTSAAHDKVTAMMAAGSNVTSKG